MQALNNKQLMQVSGGLELNLGENGNLSLRRNEYIILRDVTTNSEYLFRADGIVVVYGEGGTCLTEIPSVFDGVIRKYSLSSDLTLP